MTLTEETVETTVQPRRDLPFLVAKRTIDIGIAAGSLLLLSPVFLIVAIAIKLTSPGPVLFRGIVHGKDGRPFTYYKFRSMVAGGDTSKHEEFIRKYVQQGAGHKDEETGACEPHWRS